MATLPLTIFEAIVEAINRPDSIDIDVWKNALQHLKLDPLYDAKTDLPWLVDLIYRGLLTASFKKAERAAEERPKQADQPGDHIFNTKISKLPC